MPRIYIAGAHSRATTLGYYLKYLNPSLEIVAYLYDNDEDNPTSVNDIPVVKISGDSLLDVNCPVYLGTRGVNQAHLKKTLLKCGMKQIIPVNVTLDLNLRNQYMKKYYKSIGKKYLRLEDLNVPSKDAVTQQKAKVYVASSAFDKPLENSYKLADYEKIIQVGASLTNKRIDAECIDNIGEHISDQNAQFCELTGLYWIWKHALEDIVGLVHYRRHFIMPVDWQERMEYHNVDVILPLPLYVGPNIEENYKKRHMSSNWEYMLDFFKSNDFREYEIISSFFRETALYSPCNMFIMRREVLDDLCTWLFPILFAVAEHGGELKDKYQNRYPGFISERLITYFFEKTKDKYTVVYADKNFLQ